MKDQTHFPSSFHLNKTFSTKEGEISYLLEGKSAPCFLLIHNAGGSHEMMHPTITHFSKKGKVLAPDLLGHGLSETPQIDYAVHVLADCLIQLCQHEKMDQVIFIGLNYGGCLGIEMANRCPDLISHLILIEPTICMEAWIIQLVEEHIENLKNPQEEFVQEVVDSVFMKAAKEERERALRILKKTPYFVKSSLYQQLLHWNEQPLSPCSLPTLMIQTSQPFCTEEKARAVFSDLHVGKVVGSGPWATLEVPIQTHSMIDRFLELRP